MKPASPEELKVILQQAGLTDIDVGQTSQGDASPRMFGSGKVVMPATPKNAAANLRHRLNALGANFRINTRLAQVFVIVWLGEKVVAASSLKSGMVVNLGMMPGLKHTIKTVIDKGKFIEVNFTDETGVPRSTTLSHDELVTAYLTPSRTEENLVDAVVESLISKGDSDIDYKNDSVVQYLLDRIRNALSELDYARGSDPGANKNHVEKAIKFLKGEDPYANESRPS